MHGAETDRHLPGVADDARRLAARWAELTDVSARARGAVDATGGEALDLVDVARLLDVPETTFGRLDALVNNAGTTTDIPAKDFDLITPDEWDRVFAVNVRGLFQVTRAFAPLLKTARGSIVNTASIVGLRPGPQPMPYAASKAAVISLTKLFALNLAPEVRVNAVAPG